jgi:hypothetical protein
MNLTYSIDKSSHIVHLKYAGNPSFDEWAKTMLAVFHDPSFEPGFSFIMDRRLLISPPTTDYIERVIGFAKSHPVELGKCRTAIVVGGMASYGMARMSQGILGDTDNTQIFQDIEEAKRWLHSQDPSSNA